MKKASGLLSVHIFVDCPECDEQLDLMTDVDYINDEGEMWHLISANTHDAWDKINTEIKCPKCQKEFIFDSMRY